MDKRLKRARGRQNSPEPMFAGDRVFASWDSCRADTAGDLPKAIAALLEAAGCGDPALGQAATACV